MSYNFLDKTGLAYFWSKIKGLFLKLSGGTMTGQLKTSFKSSIATGSYAPSATTIPNLCTELRYSSGCMGSFSLSTAYTYGGITVPTGWYNFLWIPHRSGGVNGNASGDNCDYGTFLLSGMNNANGMFRIRYSNGSIQECRRITDNSLLSNLIANSNSYINTHPENSPVLIPFIHNDISFLLTRGGSAKVYYDDVEQTQNISNVFDGSPSYWAINPTGTTEIVIELTLHQVFAWTNTIYCDFGSSGWRSKAVKIEVINTNYAQDVWTAKLNTTTNGSGNIKVTFNHTPVGASNAGGGFNKIRFTFSDWNSATIFRIAQLGVYNYGSKGVRETSMSRGIDDYVFRNITPNSNNTYNLGSSSNKWANVYATTFQGNATSATKATGDKNGNDITTTYQTKLTAQTAYSAKGSATKVPKITTNSLGQVTNITEVDIGAGSGTIGSSNDTIENIVSLTKAEYDALQTKETKTLYNITDDTSGGGFNVDDVYPVGSIYMSVNSTNPSTLFGGTWEQLKDRFLLGAGDTYTAGDTGGSATNTIAKENLPNYNLYSTSHNHGGVYNGTTSAAGLKRDGDAVNKGQVILNTSTKNTGDKTITVSSGGSGTALNNMPPYLVVYIWKRVS